MVVIFHGFLGTYFEFIPLISKFKKVLFFDFYSQRLEDFIPKLVKESSHHTLIGIGYSMGGRILYHLGLQFPHLFTKIILLSSKTGLDPKEESYLQQRKSLENEWIQQIKTDLTSFLFKWYSNEKLFGPILQNPRFMPILEEKKKLKISKVIESIQLYSVTNYPSFPSKLEYFLLCGQLDLAYCVLPKAQLIPRAYHLCYFDNLDFCIEKILEIIAFTQLKGHSN